MKSACDTTSRCQSGRPTVTAPARRAQRVGNAPRTMPAVGRHTVEEGAT